MQAQRLLYASSPVYPQSYPSEFTAQLHPLMFVAGLGQPLPAPAASSTPPAGDATAASTSTAPVDPFAALLGSLRKAMATRKSWHVWDNSRGVNNDFHIIPVDKVSSWSL